MYDRQELYDAVVELITTSTVKDHTYLSDWLDEGCTDDVSPAELAQEWDDLPLSYLLKFLSE